MAVTELDTSKVYEFSGFTAYIEIGQCPTSKKRTVSVRQVGTHTLLCWTTDLHDVCQRLTLVR